MANRLLTVATFALICTVVSSWELIGSDVTVLKGDVATLKCEITPSENASETVFKVWKDSSDEVLFINRMVVQADKKRMNVTLGDDDDETMDLIIRDTVLADEDTYKCGLNGIKPAIYSSVKLTVNQHPQKIYVTDFSVEPVDGTEETVAKCFAKGGKPKPDMWFTDSNGHRIDVSDTIEEIDRENGVVDIALNLKSEFTKDDHQAIYKCHVKMADGSNETLETAPIKVKHEASANLEGAYVNEQKLHQEGECLEFTCSATGYPVPAVEWTFEPDGNTNITIEGYWPDNFVRSSDGRTVTADSLAVTDESSTNNGTFVCKASNEVGTPVSLSFHIEVYAAPVTTVPTTPEATAAAEPRSAGSDGAVIGGVVAVAAFVVIVAVILIARYFMSHKGTYRTNEIKSRYEDEEKAGALADGEDDDDLDDLNSKKRTEYFM